MRKKILLTIFSLISISAFSTDYKKDFKEAICKVLSVPEMTSGLKNWDKLAINVRDHSLVTTDTIINGIQLQFYGNVEGVFFNGHKYWLEVFEVTFSKKRIRIHVFYNHFGEIGNYFPFGRFILEKGENGLIVKKQRIKYLEYYQIQEMVEREPYYVSEKIK